jgi:RHS repeat-associated protein
LYSDPPQTASGVHDVASVAAGYYHSMALKADGTLAVWGYNGNGQLGNNTLANSSVPIAVAGLSALSAIAAGGTHSLAESSDGTLRSWGYNAYGQLGIGTTVDAKTPQVVTAAAGLKGLSSGGVHVLGLKSDATANAWGYNGLGALGNATTTNATTPVVVSGYNRGTTPRASYAYDGTGLRMSKTMAATTRRFAWDRAAGLALSDGERSFVYGPGGLPLEQVDAAGAVTWFHHDQLGSTRLLTDNAGLAAGAFTYDAHGILTGRSGSATTPLGYAGEYTDAETGFTYLRARYYEPATGQFLSRDPLVALTGSAYGYVGGNPLNGIDPTGLDPATPVSSVEALTRQNAGCSADPMSPSRGGMSLLDVVILAFVALTVLAFLSEGLPPSDVAAEEGLGAAAEAEGAGANWISRVADNGKGVVWQEPGAMGNANSLRIMESTSRYPNGYVRFYNESGQPIALDGLSGPNPESTDW